MGAAAASSFQFLTELGAVPPAYRHEWRAATPQTPLALPSAVFTWHCVHREGDSDPEAMDAERARSSPGPWPAAPVILRTV